MEVGIQFPFFKNGGGNLAECRFFSLTNCKTSIVTLSKFIKNCKYTQKGHLQIPAFKKAGKRFYEAKC